MYDHYNSIIKNNNSLIVDEDKINIFWKPKKTIPKWKPTYKIELYNSLTSLTIDIETEGLNPELNRTYAIGCLDENNKIQIFIDNDERLVIGEFLNHLKSKLPHQLIGYNLFAFDLPFIIRRCEILGINHPFKISNKKRTIGNTRVNGQPMEFYEIFLRGCNIIDCYQLVARWDYSNNTLTSKSLKNVVYEMGLVEDSLERVELSHEEIISCWKAGSNSEGWKTLQSYLEDDLTTTKLVADYLIPNYHYMKILAPNINLQNLCLIGNGTYWERVFEGLYNNRPQPKKDLKLHFKGGLSYSIPGLFYQVAKLDISGAYAWTIRNYHLTSRKDTEFKALACLEYLNDVRLVAKVEGRHQFQRSLKTIVASFFGFLGTGGLPYNDMGSAALVTAYARKIINAIANLIKQNGATAIEVDTDGIFFTHEYPQKLLESIKSSLPAGLPINLEVEDCAMYVPKRGTKNYILFHPDGSVTCKGYHRARNRCKLEKEYTVNLIKLLMQGKQQAHDFHNHTIARIKEGKVDKHELVIRQTHGGKTSYYFIGNYGSTLEGNYSISHYVQLIEKINANVIAVVDPQKQQLSLF